MSSTFTRIAFLIVIMSTSLQGQDFEEKQTSVSSVRLTITNFGTFGNSFDGYRDGSGTPSCEYPAGSGIEHLFEGGIWIGGLRNGAAPAVTTTAIDAPSGFSIGAGGFESLSIGSLQERSSFFDSRFFSPSSISHQDFIGVYTDTNRFFPGTSIRVGGPDHEPMGIKVSMETYNWNFLFSDFVVFVNLTIENVGQDFFEDLHVGLYNNTVVRNVNITPAGQGGAQFYNKGGNGYLESHNLAYGFDAAGDLGFTESYIGQKFLGATDKNGFHHPQIDSVLNPNTGQLEPDTFSANYAAWQFNNPSATFAAPGNNTNAQYQRMSDGLNKSPCWDNPSDPGCPGNVDFQAELNTAGNRSDLISAGPFATFNPGDKVTITFAYVLAQKNEDGNPNSENNATQRQNLVNNAIFAQETFNGEDVNFNGRLDEGEDIDGNNEITRFVLPTPPDPPKVRAVAGEQSVDIFWSNNSVNSIDPISDKKDFEGFKVYFSRLGFDVLNEGSLLSNLNLAAQYDSTGNGIAFDNGFEKITLPEPRFFEGDTTPYYFKYTLSDISNGWQYAVAVTAFDKGDAERRIAPLESSPLASDFRVFPGLKPNTNAENDKPFVYPNPYYYGAAWEGQSNFQEESRKLIFANLPKRCVIRIFTSAGDFIDRIDHNQNYNGSDIRWYQTFGAENSSENVFSGGEHAWDLLSDDSQIISRGLYIFSVEDLDTGTKTKGKFVIIK